MSYNGGFYFYDEDVSHNDLIGVDYSECYSSYNKGDSVTHNLIILATKEHLGKDYLVDSIHITKELLHKFLYRINLIFAHYWRNDIKGVKGLNWFVTDETLIKDMHELTNLHYHILGLLMKHEDKIINNRLAYVWGE